MVLNNVKLLTEDHPVNIAINREKITAVTIAGNDAGNHQFQIHFKNAIAFPGLINSHDHLDFNCFKPLGREKYSDYTEWGNHIHAACKDEIDAVLRIPQKLRTSWGVYKNLLSGITTVVNHGPKLAIQNRLINIHQLSQGLHSVKFQKEWKWKLNNPVFKNKACVIHTGEGTDEQSHGEIDELLKWNLLNRKLIGVHGVAMNARQAKKFTGLVWCPESNKVLLGRHADVAALNQHTRIAFGTDSTLTGNWNIWHHLRLARSLKMVSDADLMDMATTTAAKLWGMNNGQIQTGKDADIVIAETANSNNTRDDFFSVNPSTILMVISKGHIRMFDKSLLSQLNSLHHHLPKFSSVNINGAIKFVEGDLPGLANTIRSHYSGIIFPFSMPATNKNDSNNSWTNPPAHEYLPSQPV